MRAGKLRLKRLLGIGLLVLGGLYFLLLIPEGAPPAPVLSGSGPFVWERDSFWAELEGQFQEARAIGCQGLTASLDALLTEMDEQLQLIRSTELGPSEGIFNELETNLFRAAPMFAVCVDRLPDYLRVYGEIRSAVKRQSVRWRAGDPAARERLYRLLYGGRAAVEEAMLQAPGERGVTLLSGDNESSGAPMATVHGVTLNSGDILVSRGGAATSALIARGNDLPGNFSHVALVLIDAETNGVSVIESHIECGITVRPVEQYLDETKLRIMVLRLRVDLASGEPPLPHRAALQALADAKSGPVPYDFEMDSADSAKKFCSEVAYWAYEPMGVKLWTITSRLSSPGSTGWLSSLGVRHFETLEPADLEYDPQLRVVAEWRDPETLFKDHVHSAIIDVMLEGADRGEEIGHDRLKLPLARLAKGYSVVLNWFGAVGPVPEGMSATTALRAQRLTSRHARLEARVLKRAEAFQAQRGYRPPYWELVRLARGARSEPG